MLKLHIEIDGTTTRDLELAVAEVAKRISEGYTSGHDKNDDGGYRFDAVDTGLGGTEESDEGPEQDNAALMGGDAEPASVFPHQFDGLQVNPSRVAGGVLKERIRMNENRNDFLAVVYDLEDLPDNPLRDLDDLADNGNVLAAWRMPDLRCKYTPIVVLLIGPHQVEVYAPDGIVTPEEMNTIREETEKETLRLAEDDE